MGKYEPLAQYLRNASAAEIPLSFAEIERIIGQELPASSRKYTAWWSNNPANNVMTRTWLEAGFQTERVDVPGSHVVFRRVRGLSQAQGSGSSASPPSRRRHPIFGCMQGLVTTHANVDLTAPADPAWGTRI